MLKACGPKVGGPGRGSENAQQPGASHPRGRSASTGDARQSAAVYLPITTRQLADGTVESAPSGEIELDNAHVMRDAVNDVLSSTTPGKICLDLQRVMLIDSIGIGILVACFHTAAAS